MKTEDSRGGELMDPAIVNLRKKVLSIPDFHKQVGRENLDQKKTRSKFSEEDLKMIDRKIEFHQYLTNKYSTKTSINTYFFINVKSFLIKSFLSFWLSIKKICRFPSII